MIGFPFDSHVTYDNDGIPVFDRAVNSEEYRKLLRELFTSGILPTVSTNLQVTANEGMLVKVGAGFCMVDGCMKLEEEDRTLTVQASNSNYDRIDTVVMRLNTNDDVRTCDLYILKGEANSSPKRPDLTRQGSIYEIGLADLYITKGATTVSDERITDTRYENERCGIISSISVIDTSTLDNQLQAWYKEITSYLENFEANNDKEFNTWFETVKGILGTDEAGKLLQLIQSNKADADKQFTTIDEFQPYWIKNQSIETSAWNESTVYEDFPYVATLLSGSDLSNYQTLTTYTVATLSLGINFVEDTTSNGLVIYASELPTETINIDSIRFEKVRTND